MFDEIAQKRTAKIASIIQDEPAVFNRFDLLVYHMVEMKLMLQKRIPTDEFCTHFSGVEPIHILFTLKKLRLTHMIGFGRSGKFITEARLPRSTKRSDASENLRQFKPRSQDEEGS